MIDILILNICKLSDTIKEIYKKDISKVEDEDESDTEDQVSFYNQRKRMMYIFSSSCLIFMGMYFFLNYIILLYNVNKLDYNTNIKYSI